MTKELAAKIIQKHIGDFAIGNSRVKMEADKMHVWTYGDYKGYWDIKRERWIED